MNLPLPQLKNTLVLSSTSRLVPNLTRGLRPALFPSPIAILSPSPVHLPTELHKRVLVHPSLCLAKLTAPTPYPQGVHVIYPARVYKNYPEKASRGLGITQVLMGSLCIALQAVSIGFNSLSGIIGVGIWCGVMVGQLQVLIK